MASRRPSTSTESSSTAKRSRKTLTLQQKVDVLDGFRRGETTASISSALGISESTVYYYKSRYVEGSVFRKTAHSDVEAAKKISADLDAIIKEGGYTAKQVFNISETILYWKKLPGRTFISEKESTEPGFKASQDGLTLLLGANAEGDYRLKPALVYHAENPLGPMAYANALLPCYWYSNPEAWITEQIINDYFFKLHYELKCYCEREGIAFKILIVLGIAPSHQPKREALSDNVRILFLPPNTTSLLQPFDQGIIKTFKSYYLRIVVKCLVEEVERRKISVYDCWKAFIIYAAIGFIKSAWEEIPRRFLNGVWKKLCPKLVHEFTGSSIEESVELANRETLSKIKTVGFTDVHHKDIENLIEMVNEQPKEITKKRLRTKIVEDALNKIKEGLQILEDKDPNTERSSKMARNIQG
ncbi:tigger transposable element-derived protein 1-like isoform X2 [Macrobrachium nipponense]|uniref:tigger transposable element-derived protein 1-like isoform X2 n=1 Tax=Macrobrachium nipponense TaxID=159736 RepID=UPI0030C8AC85